MSTSSAVLTGFAYGEDLEGLPPRSLGYRLLAPVEPTAWSDEVEALARRLQGAPYPDHWPPTDLFCSVLLADGQRLVALARWPGRSYAPSATRRIGIGRCGRAGRPRRGLGPDHLPLAGHPREQAGDNLHGLGGPFPLTEVLAKADPALPPHDPVPVLPIRLWQEGALLFAATVPSDPDHRLALLEQGAGHGWQWLPLVGEDFPLAAYAQRGPLIAWTPHLAGVALRVGSRAVESPPPARLQPSCLGIALAASALVLLVVLAAANLWTALSVNRRVQETRSEVRPPPVETGTAAPLQPAPSEQVTAVARDQFAQALHDLLREQMDQRDWAQGHEACLACYERAIRQHPDLRLPDTCPQGRLGWA